MALFLVLLVFRPVPATAQDTSVVYISAMALGAVIPGYVLDLAQPDEDRPVFKLSGGAFDAIDHENRAMDVWLEYQPGYTWHRIKPLLGVAVNSDGSYYAWMSAAHDFHLGRRIVVNMNMGPAVYMPGSAGKELGSHGVLRSGFEIGYRFEEHGLRLTAGLHHMSHGELLSESNPGTEVVSLNLSWSPY